MVQPLITTSSDTVAAALKSGQLVALPTETVFGLAVSLNSATAIAKLMQLKHRQPNSGKVFTLVPESPASIKNYAVVPNLAQNLIRQYIPGPLTLILPKNPAFRHPYFDHFPEVGLRIPDFSLFTELLPKTGPLLLTSANLRGQPTYQTPTEVAKHLPVDIVVDIPTGNTLPSTILKVDREITVIRKGPLDLSLSSYPLEQHPESPSVV